MASKKKLLFFIPSFTIGGTITSLVALLSALKDTDLDIDIYCRSHIGPCRTMLPNCSILRENIWLSSIVRSRGPIIKTLSTIIQVVYRCCSWLGFDFGKIAYWFGGHIINSKAYSAVICYQESIAKHVCHIPACKKIVWIHCDYERLVREKPSENSLEVFANFDKIVCVSKSAKTAFDQVFPYLSSRSIFIYNIVDYSAIRSKATSASLSSSFVIKGKTIVSVGRYDPVKQFELIPKIASEIKKKTNNLFRWYIIGYDQLDNKTTKTIIDEIHKYNVENEVFVFPAQKEVYSYIAVSDILVNTSKSETFSLVIHEARALGTIPVMNDIPVAHEMIENGKTGYIATIEEMSTRIAELIQKQTRLNYPDWDNQDSLCRFINLIEE